MRDFHTISLPPENFSFRATVRNRVTTIQADDDTRDYLHDYFSAEKPQFTAGGFKRLNHIYFFKYGRVPTGLFLQHLDTLKTAGKVKVNDQRLHPRVRPTRFLKTLKLPKGVEIRDYQWRCLKSMRKASATGGTILAATGVGKTFIAALYFKLLRGHGLFIVDQLDLLAQTREEMERVMGESVGMIGNSKFKLERITVATIQTLHRLVRMAQRDEKVHDEFEAWWANIRATIIDEFHVHVNNRASEVLENIGTRTVFGMTGTLRLENRLVANYAYSLAGPVIFDYRYRQGLEEKRLEAGVVICHRHVHRKIHPAGTAEYAKYVVKSKARNDLVEAWARYMLKKKRRVIVIVERQAHVRIMERRLRDVDPAIVFGPVKMELRRQAVRDMESGRCRLIISSRVFAKGINIKSLDSIIDASAQSSMNLAQQKFGRGVRQNEGKRGLIYVDIGDIVPMLCTVGKATVQRERAFKELGAPIIIARDIKQAYRTAVDTLWR